MKKTLMIVAVFVLIAILLLAGCIPRPIPPEPEETADDDEMAEETTDEEDEETTDEEDEETTDEEDEETTDEESDLSGIPTKTVTEGELVEFPNLKATDPDGDEIKYTFTSPLDTKGKWQTRDGDAGEYKITITASDGKNKIEQEVLIIVKPSNKPPVITVSDISLEEGETITIAPRIIDPDGDEVIVTYSGWMDGDTYTTSYDDAGTHIVTITADDGTHTVKKDVRILVKDRNRPPVFAENAFK